VIVSVAERGCLQSTFRSRQWAVTVIGAGLPCLGMHGGLNFGCCNCSGEAHVSSSLYCRQKNLFLMADLDHLLSKSNVGFWVARCEHRYRYSPTIHNISYVVGLANHRQTLAVCEGVASQPNCRRRDPRHGSRPNCTRPQPHASVRHRLEVAPCCPSNAGKS
jgi:hypothetical protein